MEQTLSGGGPEFFDSSLCKEITKLMRVGWAIGMEWRKAASGTPTPTGHILVIDIMDNEAPGSNPVKITDETLLEKLRSIKGQYSYKNNPVYHYDNAPVELVVGQDVFMRNASGEGDWVTVIEVLPTGVIAQWAPPGSPVELLRFDESGTLRAHYTAPIDAIQGFDRQGYPILDVRVSEGKTFREDDIDKFPSTDGPWKLHSDWLKPI